MALLGAVVTKDVMKFLLSLDAKVCRREKSNFRGRIGDRRRADSTFVSLKPVIGRGRHTPNVFRRIQRDPTDEVPSSSRYTTAALARLSS
jgi:hypothetical protein